MVQGDFNRKTAFFTEVRMNDGQHLNDSLIDFFVSMLVAHPVTPGKLLATLERKSSYHVTGH